MKNLLFYLLVILFSSSIIAQKQNDVLFQKHHKAGWQFIIDNIHRKEMSHFGDLDISLPVLPNSENTIQVDSVINLFMDFGYKTEYTYRPDGKFLSILHKNLENGVWMNLWFDTFTYDNNGYLLNYFSEEWENGEWVNDWMSSFTNDINGNTISRLSQDWENNEWVNESSGTYTYDTNGNMLSVVLQNWEDGDWVNDQFEISTYTLNNELETVLSQYWLYGNWENSWLETYTYYPNDKLETYLSKHWEDEEWVNTELLTNTYSPNWDLVAELSQIWYNDEWVGDFMYSHTYDGDRNKLTDSVQYFDDLWSNFSKTEYAFSSKKVSAVVFEWFDGNWEESSQPAYVRFVIKGNSLLSILAVELELYYTEITGIEEQNNNLDNSPIKCSPNPVSRQINIEIEPSWQLQGYLVELYNQNGQKLKTFKVSQNDALLPQVFNIEDIPSGLYVLKVDGGKQVFTRKIIVSR